MKKFAAIFAAVLLTVSVFMVSASAKLFSESVSYSYDGTVSAVPHLGNLSNAISCYRFEVYGSDGSVIFSYGFSEETLIVRNYSSPVGVPQFYTVVNGATSEGIYSPVNIETTYRLVYYSSVDASRTGFTKSTITEAPAVTSLGGSVFDVGSSLLSFVTANWITLLSITAFVVVLSFGAIRRLVKGV